MLCLVLATRRQHSSLKLCQPHTSNKKCNFFSEINCQSALRIGFVELLHTHSVNKFNRTLVDFLSCGCNFLIVALPQHHCSHHAASAVYPQLLSCIELKVRFRSALHNLGHEHVVTLNSVSVLPVYVTDILILLSVTSQAHALGVMLCTSGWS